MAGGGTPALPVRRAERDAPPPWDGGRSGTLHLLGAAEKDGGTPCVGRFGGIAAWAFDILSIKPLLEFGPIVREVS